MRLYDERCGEFGDDLIEHFATMERQIRTANAEAGIHEDSVDVRAARSGIGFAGQYLAAVYLDVPWEPVVLPVHSKKPQWSFLWRGKRILVKTRTQSNYTHTVLKDSNEHTWDIVICVSPVAGKVWTAFELVGWLPLSEYIELRYRHPERPGWWIADWMLHPMKAIWRVKNV